MFLHFAAGKVDVDPTMDDGEIAEAMKEAASISKNMAKYRNPVFNSCWDRLQRDLMALHNPTYGYAR